MLPRAAMIQDVYIVEPSTVAADFSLTRLLGPNAAFRWISSTWATLPIDQLSDDRLLLIAVGVPDPTTALLGLRRLLRTPARILSLAVMPIDSPADLVQSLRIVADDVMFWPVRHEELLHRLRWLLTPADRQAESAHRKLTQEFAFQSMLGTAPSLMRLREQNRSFRANGSPSAL